MAHTHPVYDTDKHFVIDPVTKRISTECPKIVLPQHSHKSERFTFEIPKEVEGHDMSLCNVVEVHFQNIDAANKENISYGICKVEELKTENDTVFGSWLIEGDSTYYAGGLIFALHFACLSDTGEMEYNLPTLSYSAITIGQTVWNNDTIAKQYPDIITEFEERITALEKGGGGSAALISILDTDPAEPKEGQMWILKTTTGKLTTPVIELGEVKSNSIAIKLSNASFDGNGAVVSAYNIYVNGKLNKTASIAAGGTCVVTGLSPETEYQISVCGVSGAVLSAMSNTLTATTLEEPDIPDEPVEPKIVFVLGVSAGMNGSDILLGTHNGNTRATGVYTVGEKACTNMQSSDTYYPIPVPANATSVTVNCPNLMWGYCGYNLSNTNAYSYDVDSGWKYSGVTYTFETGAAKYATISLKKADGSNLTDDDIADISVTFGTNSEPESEQEIVFVLGHFVGAGQNNVGAIFNTNPKRAVAVSTSGELVVSTVIDGAQYYVLEVPNGATSCTVVCPNLMWGYNGWNVRSDGIFAYDVDSGWQSSGATYQFAVGAAEYVSIAFKKVPETDFVAEDVAGITITFA